MMEMMSLQECSEEVEVVVKAVRVQKSPKLQYWTTSEGFGNHFLCLTPSTHYVLSRTDPVHQCCCSKPYGCLPNTAHSTKNSSVKMWGTGWIQEDSANKDAGKGCSLSALLWSSVDPVGCRGDRNSTNTPKSVVVCLQPFHINIWVGVLSFFGAVVHLSSETSSFKKHVESGFVANPEHQVHGSPCGLPLVVAESSERRQTRSCGLLGY